MNQRGWHSRSNALLWRFSHLDTLVTTSMLNRLWQKLFLAFAVLSVATLLSLYLLQQHAFQRDFLDYVNRIGLERLEQTSVRLGKRDRKSVV